MGHGFSLVRFIALCGVGATFVTAAHAQRTGDNAVTSAGDAFGKAVGNEKIGLYTTEDIRGFNPIEAGNARIEGLYFDQQERPGTRLIEGSTVRVGISAQGYPFPAPTGIVDYRLRSAGPAPAGSLEIERGVYGGVAASVEASLPFDNQKFALTAGTAFRHLVSPQGGAANFRAFALALAWKPTDRASMRLFWSGFNTNGEDATPTLFPSGDFLPPERQRGQFLGQPWARRYANSRNYGAIAKFPLAGFQLEAGLFRSHRETVQIYADLLRGVRADGSVANRIIVADGNNDDDSISGETRLIRSWTDGNWRHRLTATVRGRAKDRDFGGQRTLSLGTSTINGPDERARPTFSLGADDHDRVRQLTFGVGYSVDWARHGSFNVSLSKSRYRKAVTFANPVLPAANSAADPWLYSAGGSVLVGKKLIFYAGYVRGLEESLVAPEIAINRSEAPPAILTAQIDAGLRYALTPDLSLVTGLFSVRKPYYAIDSNLRFGQLGVVTNRGIEISLAGKLVPGVSVVAGAVLLDPVITGDAVSRGAIGRRPVGSVQRRAILNLDWKPLHQSIWSFDLALESVSGRVGNTSNRLIVPGRTTVALGARYRFKIGETASLIRIQAANIFDEYGWLVSNSGGFTYSPGRAFSAQFIVDL